ncbi:hypothetical protein [Pseudonocardia acaciae]|uniref:hypothetical protein n=1 Tax=Pseudonocardia acaciae TaxID=551276 RepID=UPI00048B6250|nr:hypothetical protein [Pseudonocardia acaciae]
MTQSDYLDTLSPRHATLVTDLKEAAALADEEGANLVDGYISEKGRVVGWAQPTGEYVLYEGDVAVADDLSWEPTGTPRIYRANTNDEREVRDDIGRLFLAQSIRNGGAYRFTGWRDRIVAFIPEEVGPKESTIIRTLRDGEIDTEHTYSVLDACAKYAEWVNDLAKEFGGTDEVIGIDRPDTGAAGPMVRNIVQAWLLRDAAEIQLNQARHSLRFALAGQERMFERSNDDGRLTVSELARSLHTDRPNLTRAIKAARNDPSIKEAFKRIEALSKKS